MSGKEKSFGAGMIIMGLLTSLVLGIFGWIGLQASHVPKLEATFRVEMNHINDTITEMKDDSKDTNTMLKSNLSLITASLVEYGNKITELETNQRAYIHSQRLLQ